MNNQQTTTTEHWADAVLFILKRIVINVTGVGLALAGVTAIVIAVLLFVSKASGNLLGSSDMEAAYFLLTSGSISLVPAWWLLTKTKKGFKNVD
jgi:hypothetical protein